MLFATKFPPEYCEDESCSLQLRLDLLTPIGTSMTHTLGLISNINLRKGSGRLDLRLGHAQRGGLEFLHIWMTVRYQRVDLSK